MLNLTVHALEITVLKTSMRHVRPLSHYCRVKIVVAQDYAVNTVC